MSSHSTIVLPLLVRAWTLDNYAVTVASFASALPFVKQRRQILDSPVSILGSYCDVLQSKGSDGGDTKLKFAEVSRANYEIQIRQGDEIDSINRIIGMGLKLAENGQKDYFFKLLATHVGLLDETDSGLEATSKSIELLTK